MNVALIGIGRWGQTYIKTIKNMSDVKLVATCSRTTESYNKLPNELRIAPHFYGLLDLFSNTQTKIDTVIIATHPDSHFSAATFSLVSDIDVICEKPCMFSEAQLEYIEDLSRSNSRIFFTDYTNLYHNIITKFKHMSGSKFHLQLVNTGFGPFREYSDAWDYGSHVGSVIFDLFPNQEFVVNKVSKDFNGNHSIELSSRNIKVEAIFGNKSNERNHFFKLSTEKESLSWANDRSENPLEIMLNKFALGEIKTNIELSRKVRWLIKHCE